MMPTHVYKLSSVPEAGDMGEVDPQVHRCSIGECAGMSFSSIFCSKSSINFMSLLSFSSCVPVGKQTS